MGSTILKKLVDDQRGATAIEYGLIAALIVIACIAAMGDVADTTIDMWDDIENRSSTAMKN